MSPYWIGFGTGLATVPLVLVVVAVLLWGYWRWLTR